MGAITRRDRMMTKRIKMKFKTFKLRKEVMACRTMTMKAVKTSEIRKSRCFLLQIA
jgi:hypothetical protein